MKILNPKEKFILRFYVTKGKFMKTIISLDRKNMKYVVCKQKDGTFEFSVTVNFKKANIIITLLNL